jgi:hypothetical protein
VTNFRAADIGRRAHTTSHCLHSAPSRKPPVGNYLAPVHTRGQSYVLTGSSSHCAHGGKGRTDKCRLCDAADGLDKRGHFGRRVFTFLTKISVSNRVRFAYPSAIRH